MRNWVAIFLAIFLVGQSGALAKDIPPAPALPKAALPMPLPPAVPPMDELPPLVPPMIPPKDPAAPKAPADPIPLPLPSERIPGPAPKAQPLPQLPAPLPKVEPKPLPLPPPAEPAAPGSPATPAPVEPKAPTQPGNGFPRPFPPQLDDVGPQGNGGAQVPEQLETPQEYLALLAQASAKLAGTFVAMDQGYPKARRPMWAEAFRDPEASYSKMLQAAVVVMKQVKGEKAPVPTIRVDQYTAQLANQAAALYKRSSQGNLEGRDWRTSLTEIHESYQGTLITAFVFIECVKRAYLAPTGFAILFGKNRTDALVNLSYFFDQVQDVMALMARMRTARVLEDFMPYHAKYLGNLWEEMFGKVYFFGGRLKADKALEARAIDAYFAPAVLAADRDAQMPGGFDKADPKNLPQVPGFGSSGAPVEPSYVQNNDKLRQLIISLQNKLKRPEVQANPALVKTLEGILQELRPGLPDLLPLPPKQEEPPPGDDDPFNQKKKKPRPDLVV